MEKIDLLKPLTDHLVVSNTILTNDYDDMMSWEDLVLWCDSYISKILVPHITVNDRTVNQMVEWFNNLDIQEEVNVKLSEMALSGELQEIMENYNGKVGDLEDLETISKLNTVSAINELVSDIGTLENSISNISSSVATNTSDIADLENNKVDKIEGKGLSTNDFTNFYKNLIDNIDLEELIESINNKVDKVTGKGLSTNDFTDNLKTGLENLIDSISDYALSSWVSTNYQPKITYGTSDPTGGNNGDVYIKYTN